MGRVIEVVNPHDKDAWRHRYLLWFGAHAPTRLLVYASSLDDALEEAGAWLAEHAPGLIIPDEEHTALCKEACDDAGLQWPPPDDVDVWNDERYTAALESAEADLTYTESGWIVSYEWGIYAEDPDKRDLIEMFRGWSQWY